MKVTNHTDLFGRRDFLRIGSLGALGVSLDGVLRANGNKDISCILVWQSGGCGQQDTFDMKPDAPSEYRGEFKPISTNIPGIQICEHLPYTAKQADKFTILRSMHSKENNHERAINYLLTGHLPLSTMEFPSMGSIVSKELGPKRGMPPYVAVPSTFPSYGAGYLGGEYNPFLSGDPNVSDYKARDLSLPADVDWSRLGDRRWLLNRMDAKFKAIESSPDFKAMDSFYERAYTLLSSPAAKNAFDIHQEPEALRESYGRTPVGQGCLLARRLVEGGVRFVTVAKGWLNYDTHGTELVRLISAVGDGHHPVGPHQPPLRGLILRPKLWWTVAQDRPLAHLDHRVAHIGLGLPHQRDREVRPVARPVNHPLGSGARLAEPPSGQNQPPEPVPDGRKLLRPCPKRPATQPLGREPRQHRHPLCCRQ